MKLETQMVVLLLLSIIVLGLYQIPRTERIDFASEDWIVNAAYDGEGTFVSYDHTERGLVMDYDVADRRATSESVYGTIQIRPLSEGTRMNYSWLQQVQIKAYVEGKPKEYLRFQIRTAVPGVYKRDDPVSLKYNEVLFKLTDEPTVLTFDREHFQVPAWWVERVDADVDEAIPSFNNTEWVEFTTASEVEKGEFRIVVEEIILKGRWIPTVVLYRSLLWMWLILAAGVALERSLELRRKTLHTHERESKLQSLNQTLREQADELSQIARFDTLTGLLNRFGVRGYINSAMQLANSHDTSVSLILFDIDHFKKINDTLGHNHGDELLSQLGQLLSVRTSETDAIARWGGEEFLYVCCASDIEQAMEHAENLRQEIETEINITCSFGVHQLQPNQTFQAAMECADIALYKAKSCGRNRVEAFRCEDAASGASEGDEHASNPEESSAGSR